MAGVGTWSFFVAGVRQKNDDGSSRQKYIRKLRVGDPLKLIHNPKNAYSDTAVEVRDASGRQLGFVPDDESEEVLQFLPHMTQCNVDKLLPPNDRFPDSMGCVVKLQYLRPPAPPKLPTEKELAKAKREADRSLGDEYEELLETFLLDGVITADEETEARIFASAVPAELLRAVHAKILRKTLQRSVKGGAMNEENERRIRHVNGFLGRIGWAP